MQPVLYLRRALPILLLIAGCSREERGNCPPDTRLVRSDDGPERSEHCFDKAGQEQGTTITFHPNGQKSTETPMRNGQPDGVGKSYWENGRLKSEVTWFSGQKQGVQKGWDELGHLIFEQTFKANVPEGPATTWHQNGKKSTEGNYLAGVRHGTWSTFDGEGQLVRTEEYERGVKKEDAAPATPDDELPTPSEAAQVKKLSREQQSELANAALHALADSGRLKDRALGARIGSGPQGQLFLAVRWRYPKDKGEGERRLDALTIGHTVAKKFPLVNRIFLEGLDEHVSADTKHPSYQASIGRRGLKELLSKGLKKPESLGPIIQEYPAE